MAVFQGVAHVKFTEVAASAGDGFSQISSVTFLPFGTSTSCSMERGHRGWSNVSGLRGRLSWKDAEPQGMPSYT